jgi:hypothetical protein
MAGVVITTRPLKSEIGAGSILSGLRENTRSMKAYQDALMGFKHEHFPMVCYQHIIYECNKSITIRVGALSSA